MLHAMRHYKYGLLMFAFLCAFLWGTAGLAHAQESEDAETEEVTAEKNPQEGKSLLHIDEAYKPANLSDLIDVTIVLGGVSLDNQQAVDEYIKVQYCDIYKKYFEDDFEWQKITATLREEFDRKRAEGEIDNRFYFVTPMFIQRYDFKNGYFPLTPQSSLRGNNALEFYYSSEPICGVPQMLKHYPQSFTGQLSQRVTLDRVIVTEEVAKAISDMPMFSDNTRQIYAQFNFTINSFDKIWGFGTYGKAGYFRIHLDNIIFYIDSDLQTPVSRVDF